jgi:hypothetical protein
LLQGLGSLFEKAGTVEVEHDVRAMGAEPSSGRYEALMKADGLFDAVPTKMSSARAQPRPENNDSRATRL